MKFPFVQVVFVPLLGKQKKQIKNGMLILGAVFRLQVSLEQSLFSCFKRPECT